MIRGKFVGRTAKVHDFDAFLLRSFVPYNGDSGGCDCDGWNWKLVWKGTGEDVGYIMCEKCHLVAPYTVRGAQERLKDMGILTKYEGPATGINLPWDDIDTVDDV